MISIKNYGLLLSLIMITCLFLLVQCRYLHIQTIKWDTSEDKNNGYLNNFNKNLDGKDLKDDTLAIQSAINQSNRSGGGEFHLPPGKYYIDRTIKVKPKVKLLLDKGTSIYIKKNVTVFKVSPNAAIQGGTISTGLVKKYNSSVIYLNGKERFSSGNHHTTISDVNILGNGNGIALFFEVNENFDCISWVQVSALNIYGFNKGIYMKTAKVKNPDLIWINGNTFDQINISDCNYGIFLDGNAYLPNEIAGNSFTNIQIQISKRTNYGIYAKGNRNYFQGTIWDSQGTNAAKFDTSSYRNKIVSNIRKDELIDLGKENLISNY